VSATQTCKARKGGIATGAGRPAIDGGAAEAIGVAGKVVVAEDIGSVRFDTLRNKSRIHPYI
jgi:hypothetical protein